MRNCTIERHHAHTDEEEDITPTTGKWECAFCEAVHDHDHPEERQLGWQWECYTEGCEIKTKHEHGDSVYGSDGEGDEDDDGEDYEDSDEEEESEAEDEVDDGRWIIRGAMEQLAPMEAQAFLDEARRARERMA